MHGEINSTINVLPPFKYFVHSIGELPTSYLESMSYYETLVWLCNYLAETIIPTVNNTGEAVTELQNLYIQLQDYVNNYFNNLDITQEINNKLDEMAENGSLGLTISGYINPYLTQFNNRLNIQDQKIDAVESGSPLVASSTSGMTDTTRVYVNTSNGKWYYYNGSAWTIGGTYQATGINNDSINITKLSAGYNNNYLYPREWVLGSVGSSTGNMSASTTRIRFSRKIWVKAGTVIKFTNTANNDLDWSYQTWPTASATPVGTNSGWITTSEYVVPTDCYICPIVRYHDNSSFVDEDQEIITEKFEEASNSVNFYVNYPQNGFKLVDFYTRSNPFVISENYDNGTTQNNINIQNTSYNFWIQFENLVEYYQQVGWSTTNKANPKMINFSIDGYGTYEKLENTYTFNITIPNNYALILDLNNSLIKVIPYGDLSTNDALLLRNCDGIATAGAFVEINNFWKLREIDEKIKVLPTLNSYIDFDVNVKGIAHRGYSEDAPENTLPAYQLAREKGFNYVECDVSFTSDNIPVLLHDNTINRTSNGTGAIGEMTYDEVYQYDFGSWKNQKYAGTKIPTFEEFISLCKNLSLHPYIELKNNETYTESQITGLVDTVIEYGMKDKVTWISYSSTYLNYVKTHYNKANLGLIVSTINATAISTVNSLKNSSNNVFIDANISNITDERVDLAIENGTPLEVWTINSTNSIINMNKYITGVTSNYLIAGKVLYEDNID